MYFSRFFILFVLLCGTAVSQSLEYERVYAPWHVAQIRSTDWNAESNTAASLSIDGQVFVWRVGSAEPLFSLFLSDKVVAIDHSPDGRLLAAVYQDQVEVYRLGSREPEVVLKSHEEPIKNAVFGPNGKVLATSSKDKTVRLWPVGRWTDPTVLQHQDVCDEIAFSPDGTMLATCAGWEFGEVLLWNVKDGVLVRKMTLDTMGEKAHPSSYLMPANDLAFSEDGSLLASGEYSGFKVWDVKTGLLQHRWDYENSTGGPGITSLGFAGTSLRFWDGGSVKEMDLTEGNVSSERNLPSQTVSVLFLPDKNLLVGELYGRLALESWEGALIWSAEGIGQTINDLAFRPGTHRLYGTTDEGLVVEWDAVTTSLVRRVKTESPRIKSLAFLKGGTQLLHSTEDGLALRDSDSLELLARLQGHQGTVREVEVSDDGLLAVTASNDRTVGVWDLRERKLLKRLEGHEEVVVEVAIVAGSKRVVSVSEDATVRLWDIESGEELARLERAERKTPYSAVEVSADGRILAVAEAFLKEQPVSIWNLEQRELVRTLTLGEDGSGAMDLSFTPEGLLWAADLSGGLTLRDPLSGQCRARLRGYSGYGWSVARSDDGQFIAMGTTGQERAVRFWRQSGGPSSVHKVLQSPALGIR